jgi:polysaccharide export outer membrane protein
MKLAVISTLFIFLQFVVPVFAADNGYQIGTGDVLRIMVYDHSDLTTVARVDDLGCITFPLAGQIEIGGQTAVDAAQTIAARLNGDYIVNPQVSVFVEEFRSKKVVIMGEVARPGLYELSGPTTLLELISKAGGLSKGAGQTATVHRPRQGVNDQTGNIISVNILDSGREAADMPIMDGDTVTIAKAGVIYVTGQVNRPAAYSLEPDMTVIKAVTMAGGFTALAAQGRIKIIRKIDGSEQVIDRVSFHDKLVAEDVMIIPESFF